MPRILTVEHQRRDAVAPQQRSKRSQPGEGIGKMMQHAGRDDEVEIPIETGDRLDRQPAQLEIVQAVPLLQALLMRQGRLADVDARDSRRGIAEGNGRRLIGTAAGHQNIETLGVIAIRPIEQVIHRQVIHRRIGHLITVARSDREIIDRLGIDPALILPGDSIRERAARGLSAVGRR
jgi:hypothetical protein